MDDEPPLDEDRPDPSPASDPATLSGAVLDALPNGVVAVGPDGVIRGANPAAEEIFGYPRNGLDGRPLLDLVPPGARDVHPALRENYLRRPVRMTMSPAREVEGRRADGSTFPVDVLLSPTTDGSGVVVALVRDLTVQKEMEARQREAEAESHRRQRLETVGTLITGVAHDFNNLLVPILTYAELLEDAVAPEGREALDYLQQSALRARDLCAQILTVSRRSGPRHEPFPIGPCVAEALHFVDTATPTRIRIREHLSAAGGTVVGDPSRIAQVVMNLCTNSAQAMRDGPGRVTVSLGRAESLSPPGRPQIVLAVEDDGPGIDEEIRGRIFEPFFSTRLGEGGTGLGLSVVDGIVRLHQGEITCECPPRGGTVFRVTLPAAPEVDVALTTASERMEAPVQVLVVDDDEGVTRAIEAALVRGGHRVITAADLETGLARARAHPGPDVIFADYEMPGVPRGAFVRAVRAARPTIPLVVCTGVAPSGEELREIEAMGAELLPKPFTGRELVSALARAAPPLVELFSAEG